MLGCSATKVNILSKTTVLFLRENRAKWTATVWFSLPRWPGSHVTCNWRCSSQLFPNSLKTRDENLLMFTARNIELLKSMKVKHLSFNDWSWGEQWILFPENLNVSRETLRFEGKNHCSLRDQSLSDLIYSKTKQKQILKNALRFQRQHQTTSDHVQ